ncbi:MAG: hypothetical protein FOGNACKC_02302 [Anaerolineae bacterium]|nr:hypothetical protein [Anaerolineae bacterium]
MTKDRKIGWLLLILILLLALVQIAPVQAAGLDESVKWITICHGPVGQTTDSHTWTIYWSALDKYLSFFSDSIGACM